MKRYVKRRAMSRKVHRAYRKIHPTRNLFWAIRRPPFQLKDICPPMFYVLGDDRKTPVPCNDTLAWGAWMRGAGGRNKRVGLTLLHDDAVRVSTVFLGLDHSFLPGATPVLWETMIFGGPLDEYQWRYTSRDQAVAGHDLAVLMAKARPPIPPHAGEETKG